MRKLIIWFLLRIKFLVAKEEMEELYRWRVECETYGRWLAEFPEVFAALSELRAASKGLVVEDYYKFREKLRVLVKTKPKPVFGDPKIGFGVSNVEITPGSDSIPFLVDRGRR